MKSRMISIIILYLTTIAFTNWLVVQVPVERLALKRSFRSCDQKLQRAGPSS